MPIYERQDLLKLKKIATATVVGCGGTGFWTAIFLGMSGVKHLILIDNDEVEEHNLNRLPISASWIGRKKIDAAYQFIRQLRPSARIERQYSEVSENSCSMLLRGAVFCCTDNMKSQQIVQAYCMKNQLLYQRIGYDGTELNVSRAFPLSFEDVPDGYQVVPSWVVPAATSAALGVASRMYKEICLMEDMSTLCNNNVALMPPAMIEKMREQGKLLGVADVRNNFRKYFPNYNNCSRCDRPENSCDNCQHCDNCQQCEDCERMTLDEHDDAMRSKSATIDRLRADVYELKKNLEKSTKINAKLKATG